MPAKLLSSTSLVKKIDEDLLERVKFSPQPPTLAIVMVGNNPLSERFIQKKLDFGKQVGIKCSLIKLPSDLSTQELRKRLARLQSDMDPTGIVLQLPVPTHVSRDRLLNAIQYGRDVELLTKKRAGELYLGTTIIYPPVVQAVLWLMSEYAITIESKKVAILGQGVLVGKPLAAVFAQKGASVTTYNTKTKIDRQIIQNADIVVLATGKKGLVPEQWYKKGAIVIDAGTQLERSGGKVQGDFKLSSLKRTDISVTPTPGGIGPLTVRAIFHNLLHIQQ